MLFNFKEMFSEYQIIPCSHFGLDSLASAVEKCS